MTAGRPQALGRHRRFHQIVQSSRLHEIDGNLLIPTPGHNDDRHVARYFPDVLQQGQVVDPRHVVIEDHAIECAGTDDGMGIRSGLRLVDGNRNPALHETAADGAPVELVVVHDEHAQLRRVRSSDRPSGVERHVRGYGSSTRDQYLFSITISSLNAENFTGFTRYPAMLRSSAY